MAISSVLSILLACAPPPHGLFVIASRAELRRGIFMHCATMLLVLDLATALLIEAGLRVLTRELAVGVNSLDVAVNLLGPNMLAAADLLPSAALSSSALFAVFTVLLGAPGAEATVSRTVMNLWLTNTEGSPLCQQTKCC